MDSLWLNDSSYNGDSRIPSNCWNYSSCCHAYHTGGYSVFINKSFMGHDLFSGSIGALSSVVGLYFSFSYNLASGATIVLVATFLFALAFFFSPSQGLFWRAIKIRKIEQSCHN